MITDGKKWRYLAVTSLSRLLRGITSNHDSSDKWGFIAHPIYYNLTLYPTTVGVWAL